MTERSRGPEGSSGPAATDRPDSSGDVYAAAAASIANRNGGANRQPAERPTERPSSSSGDTESQPSSFGAKAGQVLDAMKPSNLLNRGDTDSSDNRGSVPAAAAKEPKSANAPRPASGRGQKAPASAGSASSADERTVLVGKPDRPRPGTPRGSRRARLRLARLDPWSVMKTSFLFSIAAGIVLVVAVYAVWLVIGSSGLFSSLDSIVGSVLQSPGDTTPFRIEDYVNTQKVMGVTAFLACVDVVIITALSTLASFLYNLAATMLGGLEVTLAED